MTTVHDRLNRIKHAEGRPLLLREIEREIEGAILGEQQEVADEIQSRFGGDPTAAAIIEIIRGRTNGEAQETHPE